MTIQCGTVPRSSIAACKVSTMRRCIISYSCLLFGLRHFTFQAKNGGPQKASLSQQMLQTPVVLNRFEGAGASFPPMATPTWRLQVGQVPWCWDMPKFVSTTTTTEQITLLFVQSRGVITKHTPTCIHCTITHNTLTKRTHNHTQLLWTLLWDSLGQTQEAWLEKVLTSKIVIVHISL